MSVERVRTYLSSFGRGEDILEFPVSTATVELAAQALGIIPPRIAKSIALKGEGSTILLVTAGDARLDNKKFRAAFGIKPKMLTPDEALEATGYAVGGVCPFGLPTGVILALDTSLKRFSTVYPACGSTNSAIETTIPQLEHYLNSPLWVDACKDWAEDLAQ